MASACRLGQFGQVEWKVRVVCVHSVYDSVLNLSKSELEADPPRNLTHMLFRNTNPEGELKVRCTYFDNWCFFVSIPDV